MIANFINYLKAINSQKILIICATIILTFLFFKSILTVDWTSGDTWMYQLPFAARFWGMVTPENYTFEAERETFYGTSTMLANILQGFFWYLFGLENPQGANLVSFLSLIIYFIFVRIYLNIPFYLSTITILAVPLIHIASTACYIDLVGNVCLSITLIMTYLLYIKDDFLTRKNLIIFVIAGAGAANIKYLLVPPLTIIIFFALVRIIWLFYPKWKKLSWIALVRKIAILVSITIVCCLIIFATEFKNLLRYGNPFYPLKVEIFGIELNHAIVPSSNYMSEKIQAMFPIQRWIYSLLEIGAFDQERPWPWTIAMDYVHLKKDTFGMGGYLAIYVVFNVLVFAFLCRRWCRETKVALGLFILLSIITPFLPFAYQLRYYMYWIITLITLNLYLVSQEEKLPQRLPFVKGENMGYIGLIVLIIFCVKTSWVYTYPNSFLFPNYLDERVDRNVIADIKDGEKVCLVGFTPLTFLYNSQFHPGRNYSVKAEFKLKPKSVQKKCGDRRIIYKE